MRSINFFAHFSDFLITLRSSYVILLNKKVLHEPEFEFARIFGITILWVSSP